MYHRFSVETRYAVTYYPLDSYYYIKAVQHAALVYYKAVWHYIG